MSKQIDKPIYSRCKNPLCLNIIYRDGFKYGAGDYCDLMCKSEGVGFLRKKHNEHKRFMKAHGLTEMEFRV